MISQCGRFVLIFCIVSLSIVCPWSRDTQTAAQDVLSQRIVQVSDEAAQLEARILSLQTQLAERAVDSTMAEALVQEQRAAADAAERLNSAQAALQEVRFCYDCAMFLS